MTASKPINQVWQSSGAGVNDFVATSGVQDYTEGKNDITGTTLNLALVGGIRLALHGTRVSPYRGSTT